MFSYRNSLVGFGWSQLQVMLSARVVRYIGYAWALLAFAILAMLLLGVGGVPDTSGWVLIAYLVAMTTLLLFLGFTKSPYIERNRSRLAMMILILGALTLIPVLTFSTRWWWWWT